MSANVAYAITETVLYFPKGIIIPVVKNIDAAYDLIMHDNIACAHCDQGIPSQHPKSEISLKVEIGFKKVHDFIYQYCFWFFEQYAWNFNKTFFGSRGQYTKERLDHAANWLITHRNWVTWYCMIPCAILSGCALKWGISVLPDIYVFLVASTWSGKILNAVANLLVRRSTAEEWKFVQNSYKDPSNVKSLFPLLGRLLRDIALVSFFGKIYQFLTYCFHAFFSWLAVYIFTKTSVEQLPTLLVKIENNYTEPLPPSQYLLFNPVYSIGFTTFKALASEDAISRYAKEHNDHHNQRKKEPQLTCKY